jgi:hypothetical protein
MGVVMSKVDLAENICVTETSPSNVKKKYYPSITINPDDFGITKTGQNVHLEFDCYVTSFTDEDGKKTARIELRTAYTEDEEDKSGDDIQDDISKGVKEAKGEE